MDSDPYSAGPFGQISFLGIALGAAIAILLIVVFLLVSGAVKRSELMCFFRNPFRKRRSKGIVSSEELSKALDLGASNVQGEKVMLEGILTFYNKTASEIMTPRLDVHDLDINTSFKDVLNTILESGYSRLPAYEQTQDNVIGILYVKDLLPYINNTDGFEWQSMLRPAYFVPETKKIDNLLEEFRTNKIHMAIVVDEYGGTSGIVTMEDVIEELVGDIADEYDTDDVLFETQEDGSVIFQAKIPLSDFYKISNTDATVYGDLADDVDTLGGLLLEMKGSFPEEGETMEYNHLRFKIVEMDARRIIKVCYFSEQNSPVV